LLKKIPPFYNNSPRYNFQVYGDLRKWAVKGAKRLEPSLMTHFLKPEIKIDAPPGVGLGRLTLVRR
jgi:hypothetical protein